MMINIDDLTNEEIALLTYALEDKYERYPTDYDEYQYSEEFKDAAVRLRNLVSAEYQNRKLHYTMFRTVEE